MNSNFALIDAIYRSRMTVLDLLAERGYDVDRYRTFTPDDAALALPAYTGLGFTVTKKDSTDVCDVRYYNNTPKKIEEMLDAIPLEEVATTEYIVMIQGSVIDAHHACALKQYIKPVEDEQGKRRLRKLRVSFFSIYAIVINPLRHVLVPKHEIVPEAYHKKLMESLYITTKAKFPEIKYHIDPITRCIGAVPGDIIRITRPSQSSGETVLYRVCVV
jgi:DNA-directed RNA polymerase subunit H